MNKMILTVLILAATFSMVAGAVPGLPEGSPDPASREDISTFYFNNDNEGWQSAFVGWQDGDSHDNVFPNVPAQWSPSLGDNGAIFQEAPTIAGMVSDDPNTRAYWLGYIGQHGFMGNLLQKTLQCNVLSTGSWQNFSSKCAGTNEKIVARFVVSRESDAGGTYAMYVSRGAVSLDMNSFTGWETFALSVNQETFMRWPNLDDPSQSFSEVMAHYDQIGLYLFTETDDLNNINGGEGTWICEGCYNPNGICSLVHYGAYGTDNMGRIWGVDNLTANYGVVFTDSTTMGSLKALFR